MSNDTHGDFDSSGMDDDEYDERLRAYIEEQADATEEAYTNTFGEDVLFYTTESDIASHTVEFTFASDEMTHEDVKAWAEFVLTKLPEGAVAHVHEEPTLINVEDLTAANIGASIKVSVGKTNVEGTLEGVFTAGEGTGDARVLIIDGRAWRVTYGVAQLGSF